MSQSWFAKKILKEILNIFSLFIEKMEYIFEFHTENISQIYLRKRFREINFYEKKIISFETNALYIYFIQKTYDFLETNNKIYFHSPYSVLYFKRIIRYLAELIKSNVNVVEDDLVKLFFYLLFLFFEEKLENRSNQDDSNLKIGLDETFFKGTFVELMEKYSSQVPYKDSQDLIDFIGNLKKKMKIQIISRLDYTFQYIKEILKQHSNHNDELMKKMYEDAGIILHEIDLSDDDKSNDLSNNLINKLNNFYSNENYLIFTNYISENKRDDLKYNIDQNFLQSIKKDYFPSEFDYSFANNLTINEKHNEKIDNYVKHRDINYKRMEYSWFPEVFKFGLDNEISIFAFSQYKISTEFDLIHKFKIKLENLEQKNIINIIKEILDDNDFYDHYFSILKSDIIKDFFNSNLTVNENDNTFQKQENQTDDSECFDKVYSDFIKQYDRRNENYKDFKNLIIYKILPYGDRAYTLKQLKKLAINPVQFFLGNDLKGDLDVKIMLKGYLIVILLHETEHFLRLLDKDKRVSPLTPRQREGGKLFIKYLFDVYSINHINKVQAEKILNINNWKDHKELRKIFINQLEEIEEEKGENFNEFLHNYFKNSISFFTRRIKNDNSAKKFKLEEYLKK